MVDKALPALPRGIDKIYLRGDSALYAHELMGFLDAPAIGYAISAEMNPQLAECIAVVPEHHWKPGHHETDTIREYAEVNYLPSDGTWKKGRPRSVSTCHPHLPAPGRTAARRQPGARFCIVTNRSDPAAGSGLDLIRWHRQKADTIEHAHDVLMNELAGAALPSQKFGANAARLRLSVVLHDLLSAHKRVGLPEEFDAAFLADQHRRKNRPSRRPCSAAARKSPYPSPLHREPALP